VTRDLINGKEFKGIELRIDYKSVLALATVPAEAASVQMLKFKGCYRRRRLTVSREAFVTLKQNCLV
jgi:hypothetical protein